MSGYKQHLVVGALVVFFGFFLLHRRGLFEVEYFALAPYLVFLSDVSDIDSNNSFASRVFHLFVLSLVLVTVVGGMLYDSRLYFVSSFLVVVLFLVRGLKHRSGFTHGFLGIALTIPLLLISKGLFLVGLVSFTSHLILDQF